MFYLWSCFNETFLNCPFGYSRGVFCQSTFFFGHVFLQPEQTLDLCETNQNDSTSDTCDTCAQPYIYSTYILSGMIQLQHYSSFLHVVGTLVEIQHTAVCVHVPGTNFIPTYFATTNHNSSSSATAASFVCCLLYAIYGSIHSYC